MQAGRETPRRTQDLCILGSGHPQFAYMRHFPTCGAKPGCRGPRHALIEQQLQSGSPMEQNLIVQRLGGESQRFGDVFRL